MLRKSLNVVESQYQPSDKTSLWLKKENGKASLYYNDGIDWKSLQSENGGDVDFSDYYTKEETDIKLLAYDIKDRAYIANQNMGYKVLDKDKSIISQMTEANTIYEIRYDFDLGGETLTVPENCTLKFEGGGLKNGGIVGNSTVVENNSRDVLFHSVSLSGEFKGEFYAENLDGDDTYIVSTLFYLIANGSSKIEFKPNTTYNVNLKFSDINSRNRRVSQIIANRSNLSIIGNNAKIIENNTDTTIGSSNNEFWDILRFVGCSNVNIYDLNFIGNTVPDLVNTTDGWVFINLSDECSSINLYNVGAENSRAPLESSTRLINSNIYVHIKNTGYAACIYYGNNLNISCHCDTTHRVLYLEGVTNSKVTATTNGIKGAVAILLRDHQLLIGDTTTYIPCDNIDINLTCDHLVGNDHTFLIGQLFYDTYIGRAKPYNTNITCSITGSVENNVYLFSDNTLLPDDTINAEVSFCIDTVKSVWLLYNSSDSDANRHPGILHIKFSGSNLTGVTSLYQNATGTSNISLDSIYGRADRGLRIYSGSISSSITSKSNVLYIGNCPKVDFSYSDRVYNLPDVYYINSGIFGTKFNKLINIGSSDKPTIEGLTDSQSVNVTGESSKLYSGASLTSITITAAKTDSSQNGVEEVFQFSTGASPAITITGVSWANSDVPTFEANKTYEIHIIYNATLVKFLATYAVYE